MFGTILSGVIGIFFLTGAVLQFLGRGSIWSAEYFASSVKEKNQMRRRRSNYYWSAAACFLIGLSLILFMLHGLTEWMGFVYIVCFLIALLFLLLIYASVKAVKKGAEQGAEAVVHRRGLEEEFSDETRRRSRSRSRAAVRRK